MLAKDIAILGFPMLRLEDNAAFILKCMEDFEVQHLPVVKDEYFIGLVSKENILDMDAKQTIAQLIDPLVRFGIAGSAHFLTALHLFSKHQLTLLPVLNDQQECVGVIPQKNLNDQLAQFLGLDQPGAVIVLSISPLQYSLAEMSRLVETNNAQIVQLNSFFDESTDSLFERINEILLAKKHKPFNADSTSHKKFKNNFLQRIQSIQTQHPFLDLRAEQTYFS